MQIFDTTDTLTLYEDNAGCIAIAKNMESKRCKHIDVKHHFIRDNINKGNMKVEYVPTTNQIADVLTKALDANTFTAIRNKLLLN